MPEYFWQKVGMLFAILVSSVVMGFLPLALKRVRPGLKKRLLSFGNSFAGGVFFAIGFLHLLAESDDLLHETLHLHIPLSYILSIVGFIAVFFVEKILLSSHAHGPYLNLDEKNSKDSKGRDDEKYGVLDEGVPHHASEQGMFAYILTFVLSVHSLISGVALGMDNLLSTLISLFVAIISHKWIEAFALGVAINKVQTEDLIPRTFKLILLYSLMEPLGIVIGLILSSHLSEHQLLIAQAFVLGLASGTFIYVAVVDILPSEFGHGIGNDRDRYIKFGLLFMGIFLIGLVVTLFAHTHEEEGHDH
jgi:zinc transporter 1/2/3